MKSIIQIAGGVAHSSLQRHQCQCKLFQFEILLPWGDALVINVECARAMGKISRKNGCQPKQQELAWLMWRLNGAKFIEQIKYELQKWIRSWVLKGTFVFSDMQDLHPPCHNSKKKTSRVDQGSRNTHTTYPFYSFIYSSDLLTTDFILWM